MQPLPDSQYNGNPESVGYRVKYWRPDLQSPALAHVVHGRLERECAIEELEEWTEYELQLQAFNAVGAGPWSEAVRGRTRESGETAPPQPRPGHASLGQPLTAGESDGTGPAPATPPWGRLLAAGESGERSPPTLGLRHLTALPTSSVRPGPAQSSGQVQGDGGHAWLEPPAANLKSAMNSTGAGLSHCSVRGNFHHQ